MKTSIIIPTCSNPSKLERLLSSIPVYKADSLIKQILIVDDSSDEKSKTENKRIAQTYPSTLYINKEIFESIFPTYRSDTQNSPSNFLKLGT
ncbi:MAG: glycosyltransferase, partial [Nanoarchaeota archaeon]|nr:glycosyltransferase [Nanoarchaeota archaeon]